MATNKLNKLELTWIGKDEAANALEPRIFIETPEYGYGTPEEGILPNGKQWHGNMLIHGDNLLALKALESDFANQVKCVYIDPPYNTGNAFEHYDDNQEHSIWLNLMFQRIQVIYNLLRQDGVFCMHLDDCEVHYAKVICDEIFGRNNFIATIAIRSSTPSGVKTAHRNKKIIKQKDLMLVYKKSDALEIYPQYIKRESWDQHYSLFICKDGEKYYLRNLIDVLLEQRVITDKIAVKNLNIEDQNFKAFYIKNKDNICRLQSHKNDEARAYSLNHKDEVITYKSKDGTKDDQYYNGQVVTRLSNGLQTVVWNREISEDLGMLLCDFWDDIDFQNTQNEGNVDFPTSKKPEALIFRILSLFTKEGDLVFDSFLGSGTTAAVAQKMNRKWIGIELGNHAKTHCYPRLKNVVSGNDPTGMTAALNWQGGGGFRFYELAPSLLNEDKFGNMVINKDYNADMLAAAMAKHEGFTYEPNTENYWKQGYSSEHDYIYTTTQFLTAEGLDAIHSQMGEDESLLICCTKFQSECNNRYGNITIKKIPKMLLDRCEFAKDDYSLNIVCPPSFDEDDYDDEDEIDDCGEGTEQPSPMPKGSQLNLFD
jgi:adenine-specific DNA-methyltransferase